MFQHVFLYIFFKKYSWACLNRLTMIKRFRFAQLYFSTFSYIFLKKYIVEQILTIWQWLDDPNLLNYPCSSCHNCKWSGSKTLLKNRLLFVFCIMTVQTGILINFSSLGLYCSKFKYDQFLYLWSKITVLISLLYNLTKSTKEQVPLCNLTQRQCCFFAIL